MKELFWLFVIFLYICLYGRIGRIEDKLTEIVEVAKVMEERSRPVKIQGYDVRSFMDKY